MTRDELLGELAALERHLASRVQVWRVIIDANGQPTGTKYYRGSFAAANDWKPPSLGTLIAKAKGRD